MYTPTRWEDHTNSMPGVYEVKPHDEAKDQYTIKEAGAVMVPGTPQDQTNFNNMEAGVLDAHIVASALLNFARQTGWRVDEIESWVKAHNIIEAGTASLTNSLAFPFNNSVKSVALSKSQNTTNYIVMAEVSSYVGNVGEVVISDKLVNGFKIAYTGSAQSATVKYIVIGGFNE